MNEDFCIMSKRTGEQRENRGVAAKLQVYTNQHTISDKLSCASSLFWNLSINILTQLNNNPTTDSSRG